MGGKPTRERVKSTEEIVDSEDFTLNTYWENMQLNKYLCVNRKNLAKKYFEWPAGNAEEDDDNKMYGEQHVELQNEDPPLNISWKTLQQNKYLRVDKKHLVKKYYELLKMTEETKRNNSNQTLQQNKYLHVDKKHLVKKYYELLKMMEETKRNNLYQTLQQNKYLRVDKKHLVKKYYELQKMMEETKRNNLYQTLQQNNYLRVDKKHLMKKYYELLKMTEETERKNLNQAQLTSQCSCESRFLHKFSVFFSRVCFFRMGLCFFS